MKKYFDQFNKILLVDKKGVIMYGVWINNICSILIFARIDKYIIGLFC